MFACLSFSTCICFLSIVPIHFLKGSLMSRRHQLSIPRPATSTNAKHSPEARSAQPTSTTSTPKALDPKAGVAHRAQKGTYIRHKLGLTPTEWEALDAMGEYLFPALKRTGQRPSRGMIVGEIIRRMQAS